MTVRSDSSSGHWKKYPEYKGSGVEWLGEIPVGWDVDRLRFHININPTKSELGSFPPDSLVSFVPMEAVSEYGGIDLQHTKELEEVSNGYTYFKDGDVVVAKITPCFENGKGSIAEGLNNGIGFGTTELHVLRPLDDFDKKYLFYVTISHPFRNIGTSYMYGAGGQKRVPEDFIRNLMHPAPPLLEQKEIAAFLDERTARIDTIIEKKERQIKLLKEKRSALISHAVTKGLDPDAEMKDSGIEWLGEIPVGWSEPHQIRRLVKFHKQGYYTNEQYVDDGVKLLRITDIDDFGNVYLDSCPFLNVSDKDKYDYQVKMFDFLFARSGSIGRFGIVRENSDAIFASYLINFRFFNVDIEFLKFFFFSNCFKDALISELHGGANQNVHAENIKNQYISCPSLLEQKAIAAFLDRETARIDGLVEKVERSVSMLKEYRAALISAAVTGKIDVRGEVQAK